MSSALAIAGVTAVLKDLLHNGVIDHDLAGALGGPVTVTALPPDRITIDSSDAPSQLNIFMYQVTPNTGWRNVGLPSRDGRGDRLTNAPLALDLHYLITAYGVKDLHTDILLGYAMQLLHETPVLTRDAIRTALSPSPVIDGDLPDALKALADSELADQAEQIKITPQSFSTEEIMKLWSAFQAKYRPTAAYLASVVLIQSRRTTRSALPVLTRGDGDDGVIVQPNLVPPFPTLQEALPPNRQPAFRMSDVLTLRGHHLDGDTVLGRFTHARSGSTLELPAELGATAAEFQVQIPPNLAAGAPALDSPQNPNNWQAGIYGVSGLIKRTGQQDRTTNELSVALAPSIVTVVPDVAPSGEVTLTVTCSPKVRRTQRASLVISDREILAEPIADVQTDTLTFEPKGLERGSTHWVRLRVDGVESILIDRRGPLPVFDPSQQVTIP
jgi:hypothetical protein